MKSRFLFASLSALIFAGIGMANASEKGCPSCATEAKYVQEDVGIDDPPFVDFMKSISASRYSFRLVVSEGPDEVANIMGQGKMGRISKITTMRTEEFIDRVKFVDNNSRTLTSGYPIKLGTEFEVSPLYVTQDDLTLGLKLDDRRLSKTVIMSDGEEGDYAYPEIDHVELKQSFKIPLRPVYREETLVWSHNVGNRVYGLLVKAF